MLDREWQRLSRCPRSVRTANSWRLCPEDFASLDDLLAAAGFRGKKCDSVADQVLARLVRRAATDPLAARIVLQRVMPPMVAIARRRGKSCGGGFDEAMASVLSHVWEVIRTYPIERRPAKIAANIVRDTEYFAFVRGNRSRPLHVSLDEMPEHATMKLATDADGNRLSGGYGPAEIASSVLVRELLREARMNDLSAQSTRVLEALCDKTLAEYAAAVGISERMARNIRREAVNELRVRTRCEV